MERPCQGKWCPAVGPSRGYVSISVQDNHSIVRDDWPWAIHSRLAALSSVSLPERSCLAPGTINLPCHLRGEVSCCRSWMRRSDRQSMAVVSHSSSLSWTRLQQGGIELPSPARNEMSTRERWRQNGRKLNDSSLEGPRRQDRRSRGSPRRAGRHGRLGGLALCMLFGLAVRRRRNAGSPSPTGRCQSAAAVRVQKSPWCGLRRAALDRYDPYAAFDWQPTDRRAGEISAEAMADQGRGRSVSVSAFGSGLSRSAWAVSSMAAWREAMTGLQVRPVYFVRSTEYGVVYYR